MKIVADSCCDLNDNLREDMNVEIVPLTIKVNGKHYVDDNNLNQAELIKDMKADENIPKSASPSPQSFIEAYKGKESVFVVTLSNALSSTYNNALLAKEMFLEDNEKFVHVFDSLSASVAETLVSMKISEAIKKNLQENEIVETVNNYIKEMKTYFVLESLDNLIKAGRINKLKGKIASVLSIKPVMGANENGEIYLVKKVRGSKRALKKMVNIIGETGEKFEDKILGIAHCNCLERAEKVKEEVLKKYNFKDIVIVDTAGISTVYANDGGIVIAF
ncbi:MAG: DegV family protein [Firmicutes bacterium]|nr:DegV family protein [Bacillota bacterium]